MVNLVGIFSRHIIVRTFVITLLVFLGITFLDLIFSIIGDAEDLNEEFTLNDLIFTTLYRLFHDSMDYVQGSCLLGALISLGLFKRDGNLTIIRSNGLSPIKISLIFALGPIIFSLLMISLDNKLFIQAANHAETINSQISRDNLDIKFSWKKDGNKILRYSQKRESEILNPTLILLDENDSVKEIISSEKAEVSDGLIKIDNSEFRFFLPKNKNLDRSTVKNIPIGSLKTYLRGSDETKLEDEEKNQVEEALKGLEEAISSEDIEAIESATKNLNDVLTPLTQKLYKQENAEGQSETNTDEDSSSENTVDAEFEEVKEEEK